MEGKNDVRKGKKHFCGICQKDLIGNFRAHLRTHDNDRPFFCSFCKWSFKQNIHLKRHVETVHKGGKMIATTRDQFECAECSKCYSSFEKLISHDVLVHQKSQLLTCQICGRRHVDLEGLMRHYKFAHSHAFSLKDDKFYVCTQDDCYSAFTSLPELEKHLLLHSKEEESVQLSSRKGKLSDGKEEEVPKKMKVIVSDIACLYCSKRFNDVEKLILHTVSIHFVSGVTCIKCGKVYTKKSAARRHLRFLQCPVFRRELERAGVKIPDLIPTLGKSTCDICNISFTSTYALDIHMRKHSGDKPHLCQHCGKGFTQKGNLKTHIETIHEGKKMLKKNPFPPKLHACNQCPKRFISAVDLRAHMRTHSGDKPFKCDHCEREFSQKGNLNSHIRRWHTNLSKKTKRMPVAKTQPFPSDENIDLNHFVVNEIKAEDPHQSQLPNYMFTKFKTADLAPSTETFVLPSMLSSSVPNLNFNSSGEKPVFRYFQHFSAIPSTSIIPSAFVTDSILNDQLENDYISQGDDSVIVKERSIGASEEDFICQEANVICSVNSSTADIDFTITSSLVDETHENPLNVLSTAGKKVNDKGKYGHCYEEMTVIEDSNDTFKMNDGNRTTLDQVMSMHDTFSCKEDDFMDSLNQTFDAPENDRKVFEKRAEVKGNTLGRKKIDVVPELPTSFETDYDPFEGNSINRERYPEETNSLNCHEVNVISYLNASFQPDNNPIELSDIKSAEDARSEGTMETNVIMAAASAQFENKISVSNISISDKTNRKHAVNSTKCLETNVITGLNQDQSDIALPDGSSSDAEMDKEERPSILGMATNVIKVPIKPGEVILSNQISGVSEVLLEDNVNISRHSSKEFADERIVPSFGQNLDMKAFTKESTNGDATMRNNSFSCKETNVIKGILSTFETPSFAEGENENIRIGSGTLHDLEKNIVNDHPSSITPITQCSPENQHFETDEVDLGTNVISTLPSTFETSDASLLENYSQRKESANPSPKCLETNVITALDLPTTSSVSETNDSIICKETNVIAFPPFNTRRSFLNKSQSSLSEHDRSASRNICLVTNVITGMSEQVQTTSASGLLHTQNNCRQTHVIIDSTTFDRDANDIGLSENVASSCIAHPTNVITSANIPIKGAHMSQSSSSFADCIGPLIIHSFDSLTSGLENFENANSTSFETSPSFESIEKELDADESISTEPVFYLLEQTKDFESANFDNYCPSVFSATPTTSTRTQVIVNSNLANDELFMSSNFFLEESNELKADNDSDGRMTLDDETDYEDMTWSQAYNLPLLTSNVGAQTVYASSTVIKNITGGEVKDAGSQHTSSDT